MKRTLLFICAGTLLTAATVGQALAVTSSGTIGATLTLTNGCLINGSPTQNGINFGTLDFGTHPATFSTLTTQLTGASGETPLPFNVPLPVTRWRSPATPTRPHPEPLSAPPAHPPAIW